MSGSLEDHLLRHPEGLTPAEVARDFLRLSGPPATLVRVAIQVLHAVPGARPAPDGRWRLIPAEDDRALALCAVTTGPHPTLDLLLALGAAPVKGGRIGTVLSAFVRPERPVAPAALLAAGADPRRLASGVPIEEVLARVAPELAGSVAVTFDSERPLAFLRHALRSRGREAEPSVEVRLAPTLRREGLIPPHGGIREAAATLRVPVPETNDPGDLARTTAGIWVAALERGIAFADPEPRPRFDFGRVGFGPELVGAIPERPGVYRFLDREGRVLYVGKAADLRSRVAGYLGGSDRRRRIPEMMKKLWRIEWEETGSELAALLAEAREIRQRRPPYNVQAVVRRRRPAAGDLVLFLPGSGEGEAELLFLREGRPVGRLSTRLGEPDLDAIRAAVRAAVGGGDPGEDGEAAQVVASWLRQKEDAQNLLDLSGAGGLADAVRKIRECLADPDLFRGRFYRR